MSYQYDSFAISIPSGTDEDIRAASDAIIRLVGGSVQEYTNCRDTLQELVAYMSARIASSGRNET